MELLCVDQFVEIFKYLNIRDKCQLIQLNRKLKTRLIDKFSTNYWIFMRDVNNVYEWYRHLNYDRKKLREHKNLNSKNKRRYSQRRHDINYKRHQLKYLMEHYCQLEGVTYNGFIKTLKWCDEVQRSVIIIYYEENDPNIVNINYRHTYLRLMANPNFIGPLGSADVNIYYNGRFRIEYSYYYEYELFNEEGFIRWDILNKSNYSTGAKFIKSI